MGKLAIKIEGISKKYAVGKQKDSSLRGSLASVFSKGAKKQDDFWALKNVSFEVEKGDVIGIIGKNGAGKSTLLKVLSQITKPTEGRIEIDGRVASLLEVGTGFHPELTGRENVYLNGTILGMTRNEVKSKFDEIVAFSGVEKFIDTPVKHYSSGMYVRLAFAVAAHLEPEILIIDEVLAVGDAEFQKKCLGKMKDVAGQGRTVLFVSHNLAAVKSLCNKGVHIKNGEVMFLGTSSDALDDYLKNNKIENNYLSLKVDEKQPFVKDICFSNNKFAFKNNEEIEFSVNMNLPINFKGNLLIRVSDINNNIIASFEDRDVVNNKVTLNIGGGSFTKGHYYLNVILYQPAVVQYEIIDNCCQFEIIDNTDEFSHLDGFDIGKTYVTHKWI
jgi:lipopolysaccharide transport system ATP-binding protein